MTQILDFWLFYGVESWENENPKLQITFDFPKKSQMLGQHLTFFVKSNVKITVWKTIMVGVPA